MNLKKLGNSSGAAALTIVNNSAGLLTIGVPVRNNLRGAFIDLKAWVRLAFGFLQKCISSAISKSKEVAVSAA